MNKKVFILYFIGVLFTFFLHASEVVNAGVTIIEEYPVASDIVYGHPLFTSKLEGGKANVEGTFVWENDDEVLKVGTYTRKVIFSPNDQQYQSREIVVEIQVLPRRVYLKFAKDLKKQYDGTDSLSLPTYIVGDIVDKDVYVSGYLEAKLESAFVGENIKVILTGLELKGENKDNYYLDLENITATIHPRYIEKFGSIKNKVTFNKDVYIPVNSVFHTDKGDVNQVSLNRHKIKSVYELFVENNGENIEVKGELEVKIKIDKEEIKSSRTRIYNYFDGEYTEISYKYVDGYLVYKCNNLGYLVIAQEKFDFSGIYILGVIILLFILIKAIKKIEFNKPKINKYKSLKRGKDYANN